jgi:beta-lactamase class A
MARIHVREDLDRRIEQIQSQFSGVLGIAAKNLTTDEEIQVSADRIFPTASAIKLSILVELFEQVEEGKLDLNDRLEMSESDIVRGSGILKELGAGLSPTIYDLATLMIVLSDNTATNMLIDRLGGVDAINGRVHDKYGLTSVVLHNRVDFEKIGGDVRRFAEAAPRDLMRLVELIARGQAVSASASQEMLEILSRQQYLDQVPRYLNRNPYARELKLEQELTVACKTGFFPGTRVDAGVIFHRGEALIAYCVVAHDCADTKMSVENEANVVNGLIGRLMVEYWWPSEDASSVTLPTRYA